MTAASSSGVESRNGPPDAVRISARDRGHRLADEALPDRRVLGVDRAEPGERAGVGIAGVGRRGRGAPARAPAASPGGRRRRASPCWPWRRPCPPRRAASTGRRLTTPPVATMTRSTSSRVASVSRASGRRRARCRPADPGSRAPHPSPSATAAGSQACGLLGEQRGIGAGGQGDDREGIRVRGQDLDRLAADRSGRPEERDASARLARLPRRRSDEEGEDIQGHDRCGEEERVDAVEHPAVARDQRPRVLRAGRPLDASIRRGRPPARRARSSGPRSERMDRVLAEPPRACAATTTVVDHDAADDALDGLRRRDVGEELRPPEVSARRGRRRCRTPRPRGGAAGSSHAPRRAPSSGGGRRDLGRRRGRAG